MWGLFKPFINIQNIVGDSYVLTWAAKWHGEDSVTYSARSITSRRKMMKALHDLMDEADAIVTYNGNNFDLKIVNQEFMELGFGPPSPYHSIDMLRVMKGRFRGTSNKLDYWLKKLSLGEKIQNRGLQLWIDCMDGDTDAFEEMIEYNVGDVTELEGLYDYVRPWIKNHPNMSVYNEGVCCTHCGSTNLELRGWYVTKAGKYRRMKCKDCTTWVRGTKNEGSKERLASIS